MTAYRAPGRGSTTCARCGQPVPDSFLLDDDGGAICEQCKAGRALDKASNTIRVAKRRSDYLGGVAVVVVWAIIWGAKHCG